ncbi:hypothetical protein P691DRAFT_812712 [Macrolepiota fuliginosa MF-IS2]|uniref:BTB domain-containing protein n=1 Tax=Macrolepiota fuliginosa MF-IS2 TaxID=1400762 RepID=A0A9P6C5K8_9AGAR|nr:hypothetical protein P691DRAFT_812712 [Macrolepiota fuliginosa MF-IS2]
MSTIEEMRGAGDGQGPARSESGVLKHDATYYLQDDPMAIFLIENRLFKVHRHFFVEGSVVFRGMFTSPNEEGVTPDGMRDQLPIPLPGVTVKEFEALLDYFYLLPHRQLQSKGETRNLQIYLRLLSISHRFVFDEVFQYALSSVKPIIHHIPAIQRFQLGEKYELREWLLSAYESFLGRTTPLSINEAEILGLEKVVRYIAARESMHRKGYFSSWGNPAGPPVGQPSLLGNLSWSTPVTTSLGDILPEAKENGPVVREITKIVEEFFF